MGKELFISYPLSPLDSFLIIDKPAGITSFGVIREVRKRLHVKKVGHSGTLDPMATGVLVLGVGKYTKKLNELIKKDKVYEAEILLGAESDTYDREGEIVDSDPENLTGIDWKKIDGILQGFIGEFEQMPPKYSAKKIDGKRACDLMRAGKEVALKAKKVSLYAVEMLDPGTESGMTKTEAGIIKKGIFIKLKIYCGSGFYVRSLAHDLGEKLGCGGLLWNLRRTKVGDFGIEEAVKLEELGE